VGPGKEACEVLTQRRVRVLTEARELNGGRLRKKKVEGRKRRGSRGVEKNDVLDGKGLVGHVAITEKNLHLATKRGG